MYDNNVYQYDSLVNQRTVNENSGKQIKLGLSYVEPITEKRFIQIAYTARLSGDHVGKNTYKVGEDVSSDNLHYYLAKVRAHRRVYLISALP